MMIETNPENTVYGSFGEFIPANLTDEEWADYDRHMAEEAARWEEEREADEIEWLIAAQMDEAPF